MTNFIPYPSIENSYREKQIEIIREHGYDKVEWVATEKVHGANFSLWPNNGQVVPAKRSGFADGSFYGCQAIVEGLAPNVLKLNKVVCGEIFGNGVQNGVNYGPKRFAAFDIMEGESYVNYDTFVALCAAHNIERCIELARGSFDDLLALNEDFVTKMSVVDTTDKAEGFVMKPVNYLVYSNGERVILKKKSTKFKEQSEGPVIKAPVELTDAQKEVFDRAANYINSERVMSAVSKLGKEEKFNIIQGEILRDILAEMNKDTEVDLSTWKSINKQVGNVLNPLIRESLFK
jgi:Rnl2 family RNA ligase